MEFLYDHGCFVCGKDNPLGLKLKFKQEDEKTISAEFVPSENHEGFPGYMHGGLISTLMDEVMARAVNLLGYNGMTARLELRFRLKVPVNKKIRVEAKIIRSKKTIVDLEAKTYLEDGQIAADATARFMIIGKMNDPNIAHG